MTQPRGGPTGQEGPLGHLGALLADLEDELGPPDGEMVAEALASLDRLDARQRSKPTGCRDVRR